jgi:hypothetical protein
MAPWLMAYPMLSWIIPEYLLSVTDLYVSGTDTDAIVQLYGSISL